MDLQTKRNNLLTMRALLAEEIVRLETEYEHAVGEESITYLKQKIADKEGELFANSACMAALNHRLEQKV